MNPEQYVRQYGTISVEGVELVPVITMIQSVIEAQKESYEACAKICDERERLQKETCGEERELEARCCAESIRQAKEKL